MEDGLTTYAETRKHQKVTLLLTLEIAPDLQNARLIEEISVLIL